MKKGPQLAKLQEASLNSDIISACASFRGGSIAYLLEPGRSCEPPQSGPLAGCYQLETFQSKQRGIYEEGVNGLFFAGHENNFTGVAFGLK